MLRADLPELLIVCGDNQGGLLRQLTIAAHEEIGHGVVHLGRLVEDNAIIAPQPPRWSIGLEVRLPRYREARVYGLDDDRVLVVLCQALAIGRHELSRWA